MVGAEDQDAGRLPGDGESGGCRCEARQNEAWHQKPYRLAALRDSSCCGRDPGDGRPGGTAVETPVPEKAPEHCVEGRISRDGEGKTDADRSRRADVHVPPANRLPLLRLWTTRPWVLLSRCAGRTRQGTPCMWHRRRRKPHRRRDRMGTFGPGPAQQNPRRHSRFLDF